MGRSIREKRKSEGPAKRSRRTHVHEGGLLLSGPMPHRQGFAPPAGSGKWRQADSVLLAKNFYRLDPCGDRVTKPHGSEDSQVLAHINSAWAGQLGSHDGRDQTCRLDSRSNGLAPWSPRSEGSVEVNGIPVPHRFHEPKDVFCFIPRGFPQSLRP